MSGHSEKIILYRKMLSSAGEERYRLALQIVFAELDFLRKQVPDLLVSDSSTLLVAKGILDVQSIAKQALGE